MTTYSEEFIKQQSPSWLRQYYAHKHKDPNAWFWLGKTDLDPRKEEKVIDGGNLDEVVVTAKRPEKETMGTYLANNFKKNWEKDGDKWLSNLETAAGFLPYVGDALDVKNIGEDLYNGLYGAALAGIGLLALPNAIEKPLKAGWKFIKRVKPTIQKTTLPYLMAKELNRNIKQGIQTGLYWHGSPSRHITLFKVGKDGGIYFTQSRDAAKLYTGTLGTGKVYNVDLNLGNKTITIDNGGDMWTKIPENTVTEAFNLTPLQVHDIIGSYNLGAVPWHYGFTKMFGYKPKNNHYVIDQVVKLGKNQGISSLVIKNVKDNGKRLFSKTMPYDLTVVYDPKQIILERQAPSLKLYGNKTHLNNGLFRLGYTTSGIKQTGIPTGNFHWREDVTDIDNPILLDVKPDMYYTRTRTTPVIKEIINKDDMLLRIGIVPIYNTPVLAVEKITVNPASRLVKVGERVDLTLSPSRVVQVKHQPRLVDDKGRWVSSDTNRYFGIPAKTEYTLWHKSGGPIKIKKKNKGKFTDYCGGKVTEECIRKGKNSSNPTTRKRANFAWVARHKFKHGDGGHINYLNLF